MNAAPDTLKAKQKRVVAGIAVGVVYVALVFWIGGWWVHVAPVAPAGRLAFALPWLMAPGLVVFFLVTRVGNARFTDIVLMDGVPPPLGTRTDIDRRCLQNSVEQFAIFVPGWLALAILLPDARLGLVPVLALSFVVARLAFWWGYRRTPTGRAFGMAATLVAAGLSYAWALKLAILG